MNNPKISVVFTSYNHKEYLKQAIDSLLTQTFRDFELIIIDDCSTDGSQEILREYAKIDERVRLTINKKNSGSYVYSTNQGASMAVAPYIIFAQCDDYADPQQIEKLVAAIDTHNVDVVFSCSRLIDEKGGILGYDYDGREKLFKAKYAQDSVIEKHDAQKLLLKSCIVPNLSAALIKKSLFDKLGGLSSQFLVLADWDFWLKASIYTDFFYIREPLNNFRQHSTTIRSAIKMKKQINEIFSLIDNYKKYAGISNRQYCYYISYLWLRWIINGPKEWIVCFPSIFIAGLQHSLFFPFAFFIEGIKVVFSKISK